MTEGPNDGRGRQRGEGHDVQARRIPRSWANERARTRGKATFRLFEAACSVVGVAVLALPAAGFGNQSAQDDAAPFRGASPVQIECDKSHTVWLSEDSVGYRLCFPPTWSPSGNPYGTAFEIRTYPRWSAGPAPPR
jgi:hypothetical protein